MTRDKPENFSHKFDYWLRGFYSKHPIYISLAVPLVPVILTIVVAMYDPPSFVSAFSFSSERAWSLDAAWRVVFIIVMSLLFIATQYMRIRGERDKQEDERDEQDKLIRALAVLPRVEFMFELSPDTYDSVDFLLSTYSDSLSEPSYSKWNLERTTDELSKVAKDLRAVVWSLASLAESYGMSKFSGNSNLRYGASLMMYVKQDELHTVDVEHKTKFEADGIGRLRFLEDDMTVDQLKGLLVLSDDLLVNDSDAPDAKPNAAKTPSYPTLALPVRKVESKYQLLGAPLAIDSAQACWFMNIRTYIESSSEQGPHVMSQMQEYFSDHGDGKSIRSLLSIPVGPKSDPMAVVSFDAEVVEFLGDRDDHYQVFTSLIRPALVLMRPTVKYYQELKKHAATLH